MASYFQPRIMSVAEMTGSQGIKICVYGRAGMGKTRLCASAPNPLILSAESGLLSLRSDFPHLPCVEIDSIDTLKNMVDWIYTDPRARYFQTFCLDSITEIAERVLAFEMKRKKDNRQAYMETQVQILEQFRRFRDIQGPNVYFSCKEFTEKDALGAGRARPWMPGQQLPAAMPYFFDEVFQIKVAKDQTGRIFSYLRCWPNDECEAKDRSGMLAEYEPGNLTYLFNKMLGNA
jgi:hypothetical protein